MARKGIGEYPPDWKEIATAIKEEHDWQCARCGHPHDPAAGRTLTIHHLDMDKSNCAWWNCACLCQACHLHIQHKVVLERPWLFEHSEWFRKHAAGFYASVHGRPTDKDYVMAHIDELLDLGQPTRME